MTDPAPLNKHVHDEAWRQGQRRLLAIKERLAELGISLDDLIDLIDARQNGRY